MNTTSVVGVHWLMLSSHAVLQLIMSGGVVQMQLWTVAVLRPVRHAPRQESNEMDVAVVTCFNANGGPHGKALRRGMSAVISQTYIVEESRERLGAFRLPGLLPAKCLN